jgi:hypothetical protein
MAKRKEQKDKQRSTKHTHKIKYRVTRTPLKTEGELRCSGRVVVPAPLVAPVTLEGEDSFMADIPIVFLIDE